MTDKDLSQYRPVPGFNTDKNADVVLATIIKGHELTISALECRLNDLEDSIDRLTTALLGVKDQINYQRRFGRAQSGYCSRWVEAEFEINYLNLNKRTNYK